MRRLTVSGLERAGHCLYWLRDDAVHADVESPARRTGDAFHGLACASINGTPVDPTHMLDAPAVALFSACADDLRPYPGKLAEVAFAFDHQTRTARTLGINIGREYDAHGARPHEVCGSADVVILAGNRVEVQDWKGHDDCGDPATSPQLRALASMAALAYQGEYRCESARVSYGYRTDGGVRWSGAELSEFALRDVIPGEISAIAEDMRPDAEPSPGEHCARLYCPCLATCPAQRARAEAAAPELVRHLPIITEQAPPTLTPAAARAAIESLCALEERVKVWWSWIDAWVDTVGPLDLGNGKVYRGWDEERESIVVDDAAELALQEHLGAAWRSAVEKSITKTNIASALKAVDPSKGQAARQRAVMASLRVAGCTRTKTIRKHGVK